MLSKAKHLLVGGGRSFAAAQDDSFAEALFTVLGGPPGPWAALVGVEISLVER